MTDPKNEKPAVSMYFVNIEELMHEAEEARKTGTGQAKAMYLVALGLFAATERLERIVDALEDAAIVIEEPYEEAEEKFECPVCGNDCTRGTHGLYECARCGWEQRRAA